MSSQCFEKEIFEQENINASEKEVEISALGGKKDEKKAKTNEIDDSNNKNRFLFSFFSHFCLSFPLEFRCLMNSFFQ